MPSRRTLLVGALALPLAGCATTQPTPPAPPPTPKLTSTSMPPVDTAPLVALEKKYKCRLGVYATGNGAIVAYRADERFAFCSTYKGLAVAALLARHPLSYLDKTVRIERAAVNSISPITQRHIGATMPIRELCDAAIRYSDGTAANLLVRDLGGTAALTAYLRSLGDQVSRMDQYEPQLNRNPRDDPRDTTTPRAIATDYQRLVVADALPRDKRALLTDWLKRITTGAQGIRAGVPKGWVVADKTGSGDYGRANDAGIAWTPEGSPMTIAIMSDRDGYSTEPDRTAIAAVARYVVSAL
jgi:beta-lactamase class A